MLVRGGEYALVPPASNLLWLEVVLGAVYRVLPKSRRIMEVGVRFQAG
jgi:hypothetical protein